MEIYCIEGYLKFGGTKMQRRIYRAIIKAGHEQKAAEHLKLEKERVRLLAKERQIENLSLFKYDQQVFLYYEFEHEEIFPEALFCGAKEYLEMVASYIFYHFQYQEEKPGDGDKYGIIGIHEDLLFFYCEMPTYMEEPSYQGLLNTNNTPAQWVQLMQKHFNMWPDAKDKNDNWRDAEVLI
jgi:hypothetical protein